MFGSVENAWPDSSVTATGYLLAAEHSVTDMVDYGRLWCEKDENGSRKRSCAV